MESRGVAESPMPAGSDEIYRAVQEGHITPAALIELGEVVLGTKQGRVSPEDVTVYKSIGNAVQDAAAAALVLRS